MNATLSSPLQNAKDGTVFVQSVWKKRFADRFLFVYFLLFVSGDILFGKDPQLEFFFLSFLFFFVASSLGGIFISAFAKQENGIEKYFCFDELFFKDGNFHLKNSSLNIEWQVNPTPSRRGPTLRVIAGTENHYEQRFWYYKNPILRILFLCPGLFGSPVVQITKEMYTPELRPFMSDEEHKKLFPHMWA